VSFNVKKNRCKSYYLFSIIYVPTYDIHTKSKCLKRIHWGAQVDLIFDIFIAVVLVVNLNCLTLWISFLFKILWLTVEKNIYKIKYNLCFCFPWLFKYFLCKTKPYLKCRLVNVYTVRNTHSHIYLFCL